MVLKILLHLALGRNRWLPVAFALAVGGLSACREPNGDPREGAAFPEQTATTPETHSSPRGAELSPLGRAHGRIAFLTDRGTNQLWEIFTMRSNGTRQRRLTRSNLYLDATSRIEWSPHGNEMSFDAGQEGGGEIVVVHTRSMRRRTVFSDDPNGSYVGPQTPDWSPDGRHVVFATAWGDLFVVGSDGSEAQRIATSKGRDTYKWPAWSPDGEGIAFTCECPRSRRGLYVIKPDGSDLRRVTPGLAHQPDWSPRGEWLAFSGGSRGTPQIYVVTAEGGKKRRLTETPENFDPTWSPDGRYIAFESNRNGNAEIYVITKRGQGETRLTRNPASDFAPAWEPRRERKR
ncbi:MAG: hypothetical protein M3280_12310 [Actinomycetota bacterium]|nr:hypothetical protein [Actinomycetota bacterium]